MRSTKVLVGGLFALLLAACSGGAAGESQQASLATANNPVQESAHRDPARFLQHFDKNGDGKVQVSELPARMQERLGKADTNGDGVISADELQAHMAQMKKERFARADKNGDGALDATEVGNERWTRIQVADANKDGKVTAAELDQARASGVLEHEGHARWHGAEGAKGGEKGSHARWRGGEAHHARSPEQLIARFDTNKDGILQTSEMPERMRPWLERADTNKDGAVTKDELTAMHARMKQARDARRAAGGSGDSAPAPAPGTDTAK